MQATYFYRDENTTHDNDYRARRRKRMLYRRRQRRRRLLLCALAVLLCASALFALAQPGGVVTTAILRLSGYPSSLIELLERNPETRQFVMDYPKRHDKTPDRDLSGEVEPGTIPLFLQWDERWGYETYGSDFLAVTGCGPTCLSMVCCGLTGDLSWNPYAVASMAQENGYYVEGSGTAWSLMDSGASALGLVSHSIAADAASIRTALSSGMPVICSMRPGDFTTSGHFIVLAGLTPDGKVRVNDPNSRKNSEKEWDLDTLLPQIKGLWGYSA